MSLIHSLQWRYATKNMNGTAVPQQSVDQVLQAINLTATSYGLQPFKVVVVTNQDVKDKLQAAAYNQPQVGSSSHVLVFAVPTSISAADIDIFIQLIATTRNIPLTALDGYKGMILSTIGAAPAEQQQIWATKQAYIALGSALAAAAELHVDSCPMEGFDATQVNDILGLTANAHHAAVMLPLGYRNEADATAQYAKVRKAPADIFITIS